ncbi:NAD-dependent epimerase/dehydratase family protein [Candidatus Parcubacteria bacterium]|nr:MAG: NAD-dependent epimerase/dehydratase family protein [Candidatus Parcubacteria bacterium]
MRIDFRPLRILVLGGDGYLGWPTALHFSAKGHDVAIVDNMAKRRWEEEVGAMPLFPIPSLRQRLAAWRECSGLRIRSSLGDIAGDFEFLKDVFQEFRPETIIHYAEQPSAPYSMIDHRRATFTQRNNVIGTLNVLYAMQEVVPHAHLVKLGTMGEYGTPNIDIEEGFIEIEHRGRKDTLPFPKQAGSWYHWSKVHDSGNISFACRIWKLRATDLNQGVVYGISTPETDMNERLVTSFHYDHVFGTALNRFVVQAATGHPITVYGGGNQKRGFLNIRDTIQCVELASMNPPAAGEFRVFNQFTEVFSVFELAKAVCDAARILGWDATIRRIENPRVEAEDHYYNPRNDHLLRLGLTPTALSDELVQSLLRRVSEAKEAINREAIMPTVQWRQTRSL